MGICVTYFFLSETFLAHIKLHVLQRYVNLDFPVCLGEIVLLHFLHVSVGGIIFKTPVYGYDIYGKVSPHMNKKYLPLFSYIKVYNFFV
ncbi:hypothetical protein Dip518_001501 [Parelusimicrobium proximum]